MACILGWHAHGMTCVHATLYMVQTLQADMAAWLGWRREGGTVWRGGRGERDARLPTPPPCHLPPWPSPPTYTPTHLLPAPSHLLCLPLPTYPIPLPFSTYYHALLLPSCAFMQHTHMCLAYAVSFTQPACLTMQCYIHACSTCPTTSSYIPACTHCPLLCSFALPSAASTYCFPFTFYTCVLCMYLMSSKLCLYSMPCAAFPMAS